MEVKGHLPNLLTLGNLVCGCGMIGVLFSAPFGDEQIIILTILFVTALVCDFFDGFSARTLKVGSPFGKELNSFAGMVTYGVVPGLLVLQLFYFMNREQQFLLIFDPNSFNGLWPQMPDSSASPWRWCYLLIPVFSALRLAKFNGDERNATGPIGLPAPVNAIFFFSLFLCFENFNPLEDRDSHWGLSHVQPGERPFAFIYHPVTLAAFTVVFSLLLVAPIRMMALKFKSFSFEENIFKYLLLASAAILMLLFSHRGVPFVILLYFCFSILENLTRSKDEVHR